MVSKEHEVAQKLIDTLLHKGAIKIWDSSELSFGNNREEPPTMGQQIFGREGLWLV